jgi:hypothetical protein
MQLLENNMKNALNPDENAAAEKMASERKEKVSTPPNTTAKNSLLGKFAEAAKSLTIEGAAFGAGLAIFATEASIPGFAAYKLGTLAAQAATVSQPECLGAVCGAFACVGGILYGFVHGHDARASILKKFNRYTPPDCGLW